MRGQVERRGRLNAIRRHSHGHHHIVARLPAVCHRRLHAARATVINMLPIPPRRVGIAFVVTTVTTNSTTHRRLADQRRPAVWQGCVCYAQRHVIQTPRERRAAKAAP